MTSEIAVLLVCTGNLCRSPFAEQWLRQRLGTTAFLAFASAGTRATEGQPLPEESARLVESHLGQAEAHRAHLLTKADVQAADLVIALAREHRRAAVTLLPRASRKTFTLREFERLATEATPVVFDRPGGDPRSIFAEALGQIAARRGSVRPPADAADDDVPDPYGRGRDEYERSAEIMIPALEVVAAFVKDATEPRLHRH